MPKKIQVTDFPLYKIKKIKIIEHPDKNHYSVDTWVNQLLEKGWILLGIHKIEYQPNSYWLAYTLGHERANADDSYDYDRVMKESLGKPLD